MQYEISFDIAAAIVFLTILVLFYTKKKSPYQYNKMFALLLWVCFGTAVFDCTGTVSLSYPGLFPRWFEYLANEAYLLCQNCATPIYAMYIIMLTNSGRKTKLIYKLLLAIPISVVTLLIVSTPWTKLMFYFTEDGIYQHGSLFILLYIVVLYYFLIGFYFLRKFSASLSFEKRLALYSFLPVVGIAVVIQFLVPYYLIQVFAMSISLVLLLFSVQNAEELLDNSTGAFGREIFCETINGDLMAKQSFAVLSVEICNSNFIGKSIGLDRMDDVLKVVVAYLKSIHKKGLVGRMGADRFCVKLPAMSKYEMAQKAEMVRARFADSFEEVNVSDVFHVKIAYMDCPKEAGTIEQIVDVMDYVSEKQAEDTIFDAADLDTTNRQNYHEIRRAIRDAIEHHTFQVYYQPIYSVKEKRIISAEALIRLQDEKLGFISPEVFIPMAEKEGYILEIGRFVFESVCSFYTREKLWERGIEYIEVNLSVIECMQHDLAGRLFHILREYKLPANRINLEITETAMAYSSELLANTMHRLAEDGFTFSMDDFGTGYAGIASTYDLPFDCIKIDKSILWTSMANEKAYIVLKHTFALIKNLNKKIVMEGVENEEHIERLLELGCDYFQGYYFSKPIPEQTFVEYLARFELPEILENS